MIKVYLDNGDIVECKESLKKATSMLIANNCGFLGLEKTDDECVLINTHKILRIEGSFDEKTGSEVESGPFSEDISIE